MDASTRFDTQIIGALPVIVNYFERLSLGTIINEVVPGKEKCLWARWWRS